MRRVFPLGLLGLACLLAIVVPAADPVVTGGPVVAGDVAWMLTAAALVLLMTPGLSSCTAAWSRRRTSSRRCSRA